MKAKTDSNSKNFLIKKKSLFYFSIIFIEDEFHQSLNVTISVNNPSSSANLPSYKRQRTVHCQKQVSKKKKKKEEKRKERKRKREIKIVFLVSNNWSR